MTKLIQFLYDHHAAVEFVGVKWEKNSAVVWAAPRALGKGFRIHNVGDIAQITHYLRCNPEVKTLKVALKDDGRVILRSVASIADHNFEIDGYILPPSQEPDEKVIPAKQQLQDWLDNFSKKLAHVRTKLSKQHR